MPRAARPDSTQPQAEPSAAHASVEVPYGVLAETAPDAILTIDEESVILSVNPATERIFGWTAAEMLGQPLTMIVPSDLRARHEAGIKRYLRTGVRHIPWTGVPLAAMTKDGRRLPIEVSFGEFVHEGRRVFSGFLRDISERVAQQQLLEETTAELEEALVSLRERVAEADAARLAADQANDAKSQFLATMSHELRTPLNAIGGYVELLETGLRGPLTPQQMDDLRRVRRAQNRLLTLINDVLSFARLETGRIEYDVRDVAVSPLLRSMGPLLDAQLRAKAIEYHCDPGPAGVTVCADEQKVEQIMLNLLSNAAKFTLAGGSISVTTDADLESVRMRVRDTGIGIPADRVEAVFEPFVQLDSTLTRAHEGTGLGLAISQEFARGMGGLITVESTVGVGTEFTLTLPTGQECSITRETDSSVGVLLARDARTIVRGMVARLRAYPELPTVTDAELEDHMPSLITDLAQLLVILDADALPRPGLVSDGARIQEVIVRLHGEQRRRLGWTKGLLEREFDYLAEEAAAAIRRRPSQGGESATDDLVALVGALIAEAKVVGVQSLGG
jgi:PAS domain S-box-containing protein